MYTPITDDAAVQLEIVDAKSVTLASETARMVAGKLPARSDLMRTIGRSSDSRVQPGKLRSETSALTQIYRAQRISLVEGVASGGSLTERRFALGARGSSY